MLRTKFKYEKKQRAITEKLRKQELWFLRTSLPLDDIHPWNFITVARIVLEICSRQRSGRHPPARHGRSHNTSRLRRAYKKEKLLITSYFSFSHSVFKGLVLQTCKQGLVWERVNSAKRHTLMDLKIGTWLTQCSWILLWLPEKKKRNNNTLERFLLLLKLPLRQVKINIYFMIGSKQHQPFSTNQVHIT